jgi:hypothetical protein
MIEIRNAAGELTYRNSFITDLPTDRDANWPPAAGRAGRSRVCRSRTQGGGSL